MTTATFRTMLTVGFCLLAGVTSANSYEAAKASMLADVTNPQATFTFVKQAIRAGDVSGAATALERLLRLDPSLSNIELELGVLYLRLGSTELAEQYIDRALTSPQVPGDVRNRALNLLNIAQDANRKHRFAFSIQSNAYYESNANAAPANNDVLLQDFQAELSDDSTERDDISWDFSPALRYSYAFDSQQGNQFELALSTYHRRYDEVEGLDLDSLNLQAGPRFNFGDVFNPSWSFRPYVAGTRINLDGDKFLEGYGGGIQARRLFSPTLFLDLSAEHLEQDYFNSAQRQGIADRSGSRTTARATLGAVLSPRTRLSISISGAERDAEVDWEARSETNASIQLTQALWRAAGRRPVQLSLSAGYSEFEHDAPDPLISTVIEREDERTTAGVALIVPVGNRVDLVFRSDYVDNASSLPNFEYDNVTGSVGFYVAF